MRCATGVGVCGWIGDDRRQLLIVEMRLVDPADGRRHRAQCRLFLLGKLRLGDRHRTATFALQLALGGTLLGGRRRFSYQLAWRGHRTGVENRALVARQQLAAGLLLLGSLIGFNIAQHTGLRGHQRLRCRFGSVWYQQVVGTHTGRIRASA